MKWFRWRQRLRDERGVALVTALFVSMAALTISIVAVQFSVHNLDQASRDRKRVQSIDVAESGIDAFESILRFTPSVSVPCPQTPGAAGDPGANLYGDLPTSPPAHYDVYASFFSAWPPTNNSSITCAAVQAGTAPTAILIKSVGTAVRPETGRPVTRTMESLVRITAAYGPVGYAVFSDTGLSFSNQLTINGHESNNGDVYTNGNFLLANNSSIGGTVYAQGTATIGQGIVKVDVWAKGTVSLSSSISVFGNAISSNGSMSLNNATVYGNAKAAGAITLSNNSMVKGTKTPNAVGLAPPPPQALPQICWPGCPGQTPSDATKQAYESSDPNVNKSGIVYTERDYTDCTTPKNDIANWFGGSSGNYVMVINAACALTWGNNSVINVKGNLAIFSFGGSAGCTTGGGIAGNGAICTVNQVTWNSVGGTWNVILIRPYVSGLNCASGNYNLNISNNTALNGLKTFLYSQCTVNFGNNNASGVNTQLIGGTVNITNQMVLNFDPFLSPDVKVTGYNLGPAYLREIANGT